MKIDETPQYFKPMLEILATRNMYRSEREAAKATPVPEFWQEKYRRNWNIYMLGQRISDMSGYADSQEQGIHRFILGIDSGTNGVCVCGLIVPGSAILTNPTKAVLAAFGHIEYPSREVVTIFHVEQKNEHSDALEPYIHCQTCGDLELAAKTESGDLVVDYLNDLRSAHICKTPNS